MGLIYMRISPSGGKYIGKTTQTESHRWSDHKKEAYDISDTNYNSILNKAIRKYGAENFTLQILEDNIPEELLDERESYWINYHRTYYLDNQHGYNMTHGGDGRRKYKEQDIYNLWVQGYSASEVAEIMHIDRITVINYLSSYGITAEEIQKHGRQRTVEKCSLKIKQYTLDGKYIKTWDSISTLMREKNYSTSAICRACKHEQGYAKAYNYLWTYEDDNIDIQLLVEKAKKNIQGHKPVRCIETGEIFKTVTDAANYYHKDRHTIADACKNGNLVKVIKLHFEFYEEK